MSAAGQPTRIELEVHFDAVPIEGHLYDRRREGAPGRFFSGWLGLIAAIEAVRDGVPDGGPR
jgi:hypothetical protein